MKITATLSFLALLPTIGAQCAFCPSGITGGNATIVPFSNDNTCEQIAIFASVSFSISDAECHLFKIWGHPVCCPADVGAGCEFCSTGVEKENLEVDLYEDGDGRTCGELAFIKTFAPQEVCPSLALAEPECCPQKTGTLCTDMCPGGVTKPDVVPDLGDGNNTTTCAEIDAYSSLLSSDATGCTERKFLRQFCCPDDVGPGCSFCEGGVSDADAVLDEEAGTTCGDAKEIAPISPKEFCSLFGSAQFLCCPRTQAPVSTDAPVVAPTTAPTDAAVGLSTTFGLMATALIVFLYV